MGSGDLKRGRRENGKGGKGIVRKKLGLVTGTLDKQIYGEREREEQNMGEVNK